MPGHPPPFHVCQSTGGLNASSVTVTAVAPSAGSRRQVTVVGWPIPSHRHT